MPFLSIIFLALLYLQCKFEAKAKKKQQQRIGCVVCIQAENDQRSQPLKRTYKVVNGCNNNFHSLNHKMNVTCFELTFPTLKLCIFQPWNNMKPFFHYSFCANYPMTNRSYFRWSAVLFALRCAALLQSENSATLQLCETFQCKFYFNEKFIWHDLWYFSCVESFVNHCAVTVLIGC